MKFFLICIIMPIVSFSVFAAEITAKGQPYAVHVFPKHGYFVFYAEVTSGTLNCDTAKNRWALSTDEPGAQALISMVITAKATGGAVTVVGNGTCEAGWGYAINYMYLN